MAKRRANGEGTIFFNKQINKWVFTFYLANGRKKTVYGASQKEVIAKKKDFLKTKEVVKSKETLHDMIREYIEYKHDINITNGNSYRTDCDTLKRLSQNELLHKKVVNIKKQDIKDYLCTITHYSKSVIKKNWSLLNNGFKYAVSKELIDKNPMDSIEIQKPKSEKTTKKVRGLTLEEQQKFINAIKNLKKKHEYQNIWLVMLYSGMRIGEVLALSKNNVDFDNRKIFVTRTLTRDEDRNVVLGKEEKTKTYAGLREVRITATLEPILKEAIKNSIPNSNNLVFTREDGSLITGGMVNSALKRFCESNEVISANQIRNHMLRHTYATRMIEAGVPAHVLQRLLGHEDISETLNTYTDVFERYEKKYDKTIEDYYANNNIILDNIDPIDVIKNDLKNIEESINISHINSKQKSILLEDLKKINDWYELL